VQAYPFDKLRQRLSGWNVAKLDSVVPCEVVRGLLDAFILDGSEAWDHAPWILLVEEAGGRFTDWEGGQSAHRRGGLFSNAPVHPALATALGLPC
jgi:histidinol-phosphatase